MKKRKKNKNNKYILIIILIILILFGVIAYYYYGTDELGKEIKKDGFKTSSNDDLYYKKIVTNNTLDSFYNDVSENKDSSYQEYNFTKSSYDFIELKMTYSDETTSTLNIISDIRNNTIDYNYEVSKGTSRLMLEGNMTNNFICNAIEQSNISNKTKESHCEYIKKEIQSFISIRDEYLKNQNLKDLANTKQKTRSQFDFFYNVKKSKNNKYVCKNHY